MPLDKEVELIREVDDLFPPVMRDLIDVDHSLASRRGVMRELGWTGVAGEIVCSQLRMFKAVMTMENHRPPKKLLLRQLQRARDHYQGTKTLEVPSTYEPPHPSRMAHISGAGDGDGEGGGVTRVDGQWRQKLQS